jgi:uncharacterized protein
VKPSLPASALYDCRVFHRRLAPKPHEFLYRVFLFAFDVDELPGLPRLVPLLGVNGPGLYSFHDSDHFRAREGGARKCAEAFLAENGVGEVPARILLLTNARFLGYTFNPISIWFCERADGSPLAAIAEVGNTFGELKPFLIPFDGGRYHARRTKEFYVSPFSTPDLDFDFRFDVPGERLAVFIDEFDGEKKLLVSSLTGRRMDLTTWNLLLLTARFPFITLKVIFLIHWQAFRLWLKKLPFVRKEEFPERQKGVYRPYRQTATPAGEEKKA